MEAVAAHGHDEAHSHDDHAHHHKDTFITKYIFSIDHKMIAKQYLISGIIMGIIGVGMSILFRMQLAWPEESFWAFKFFLGEKQWFSLCSLQDCQEPLVTCSFRFKLEREIWHLDS
jgi:hypothetical protein